MLKVDCPETVAGEEHRLRICSLSGVLATALILVGFFLPWVRVDPAVAQSFDRAVDRRIEDPATGDYPAEADWKRLADHVRDEGKLSGMDVFYWSRTASACSSAACLPKGDDSLLAYRGIRVLRVWLAAMPVLAGLLLIYFLLHSCRRAKSPALILAMLLGAASVVTVAVHDIVTGAMEKEVQDGAGITVILIGGALLFLAGAFGVKARNWWRVLGGAVLIGGAVAWGIREYLEKGI